VHSHVRTAAVTAAVLACAAGSAAAAGGTALAGGRAPAPPPPAAVTADGTRTVLTLPGAGRVLVSRGPDGAFAVTLPTRPGQHPATALTTLRLGGQDYAIPLAALPGLGRGLDLSLFNIGALARAEHDGRVPVTLRYHGRVPAVPGLTVTRSGAGRAEGYLAGRSSARIAAALAGRAGVSLALAGAAAARPAPAAGTVTVTVKGTDLAGRPDSGDVVLLGNVDHPSASGTGFAAFKHGAAKFRSAPGTYWAVALFAQISGQRLVSVRMDVLPQFKVAGNTTADARAAAATSKVMLTTPRPAVAQSSGITVVRAAPGTPPSGLGPNVNSLAETASGAPLYVSPVSRQPSHGTLRAFADGQLTSPGGTGVPYAYTLNFADRPGTIGSQHFAATAANLATVSERYYQDQRTAGAWETLGGTPYEINTSVFGSLALPLRLPGRQVQYLSASPPSVWESNYLEYRTISAGQPPGGQADAFRLLRGGQHLAQAWGEYPLHPGPDVSLPGTPEIAAYPSAARSGNRLNLFVTPFTDNQPGHRGDGFDIPVPGKVSQVSGAYLLFQNGVLIAHGNAVKTGGAVSARLSSRPSKIVFVLSASRASPHYRLSPASVDEWTWHSRPEAGATIRAPWICPDQTQRCAVQPMMTLDYGVAGLGLNGAAPAGPQAITVTAGHIQLAPSPAVTGALAQVSLNGGRTWERARVHAAGADRFRLTFTAPRSAQVSLRVTARDAAGNSLTEMILRAYRISA
jgi:hypothetical protein